MIFKPDYADLVISGEKTLTSRPEFMFDGLRRFNHNGEIFALYTRFWYTSKSSIYVQDESRLQLRYVVSIGNAIKTYAIQPGRGKTAIGRFKITRIYRAAKMLDASDSEARAEGFASIKAFEDAASAIYGERAQNPCYRFVIETVTQSTIQTKESNQLWQELTKF